ncbi:MAG: SH3 domain-containing protein [Clostridiales bacterium]|nr:SH3 domain-containing protein [Clostridiales bacterium]
MKRLLALLVTLLMLLPAAMAESTPYYIDGGNADRVHLRVAPTTQSDSMGLYYTGTDVILFDVQGEWTGVLVGSEVGYIMSEYLTADQPAQAGPWYIVDNPQSTWVNLRMSPSMDAPIALCPDNGTSVRVLGETADGWSYVDCQGVKGYMMTSLLSEVAEAGTETTILGSTADFYYIHQYMAPNGQSICFTAWEDNVYLTFRDVNFDGIEDIVVDTVAGANNLFSEFFVYDRASGEYIRVVSDGTEERWCNYKLYPEHDLVATYTNSGNAGLLHVWNLYRWEGNKLKLIRSAVSDEWSEEIFEGQTYTNIIHGDILHITVRDHTQAYDESILWELIIPREDAEYRDVFTEEMEALWQGIK